LTLPSGGIDLAYQRWDDEDHRVCDEDGHLLVVYRPPLLHQLLLLFPQLTLLTLTHTMQVLIVELKADHLLVHLVVPIHQIAQLPVVVVEINYQVHLQKSSPTAQRLEIAIQTMRAKTPQTTTTHKTHLKKLKRKRKLLVVFM
jgi:hypothetical protein